MTYARSNCPVWFDIDTLGQGQMMNFYDKTSNNFINTGPRDSVKTDLPR